MTKQVTYRELLEQSLPERSSPLYQLNLDYSLSAIERGYTIVDEVEKHAPVAGKKILDLGCGEGGVAIVFALRGGDATALDISQGKIDRMKTWAEENRVTVQGVAGNALDTGLPGEQFDIIINNDFLEHVVEGGKLALEIDRLLKPGGVLYLATQNRLSILELLKDSHMGLFGLTLLPRNWAAFYAVKIRKRCAAYDVGDIPTPRFVRDIFKNTSIDVTQIPVGDPTEKILNPAMFKSKLKRRVTVGLKRLGLSEILLRFVNSPLFQFIPVSIAFVGIKRSAP